MRFRELLGVLRWQDGVPAAALAAAAGRDPGWSRFADADWDQELPDDFVRAALAEAQLPYVWDGRNLRTSRAAPPDAGLAAVQAYLGGAKVEEVAEGGAPPPEPQPGPEPEGEATMDSQADDWVADSDPVPEEERVWALRPLLLAAIGLATGVGTHLILQRELIASPGHVEMTALVALVVTAGLIGFTIERRLWWASLLFSVAVGGVAAAVTWWNGPPSGWSGGDGWRMFSLFLAIAIAAPLFQAARDEGALSFPYPAVHDHAWTNVVLWVACWVFVVIVLALMWLLAALFGLIELDYLRELLEKDWFWRALVGLAFGAGLGLLREHDVVVRLLQRVVATVLAVLAPLLAIGLALFLLALPFTGLQALWSATDMATPVLLSCVIGALVLANAVTGNAEEHESGFAALRWGALALAVVMLPLAGLAALGTGIRIGAYGFTPERLWAVTFVAIACLFGIVYWWALVRARLEWPAVARPANLALSFVVMGVALVLATPLVSFNAIAAADQAARLESGLVPPEKFDWKALAFDYGEPGRVALKRLQTSANPAFKAGADRVANAESAWEAEQAQREAEARARILGNLRILPAGAALPPALRDTIATNYSCNATDKCTVAVMGPAEAMLLEDVCFAPSADPGKAGTPGEVRATMVPGACDRIWRYILVGDKWSEAPRRAIADADRPRVAGGYSTGQIEIRTLPRRQLYVGGVPVGEPFE